MSGVGEQMSALEVIQSNLIERVRGPVSSETGGTSKGDASAGGDGDEEEQAMPQGLTKADRVGGGVVTAILVVIMLATAW